VKARLWDANTDPGHTLNRSGLCACERCAELPAECCASCKERAARWASEAAPVRPSIHIALVDRDAPRCERVGCENVLYGRQSKFCCVEHGGAERQARFRDRDLIQFSATDVDLISQTLDSPREFRAAVKRGWRNSERAIYLGEGVWADPAVQEVFREAARRP
jgi:hypothetical protein